MPYAIRKTKDGKTYWGISYTPPGGKTISKAARTTDFRVAQEIELRLRSESASQRQVANPHDGLTFDSLIQQYMEAKAPSLKGKASIDRMAISAVHLAKHFSGMAIEAIKGADVRAYIAKRKAEKTQSGVPPSDGTLQKELGLFRAAVNWARIELDMNIPNPLQGRVPKSSQVKDRWLTEEEASRLLAAAKLSHKSPYLAPLIVLAINTGMRKSEMLQLTWDRVDLSRKNITLQPENTKNQRKRFVYLNRNAELALRVLRGLSDGNHVFVQKDGKPVLDIKRSFATAVRIAGLTNVGLHTLRHTCGTWLANAGTPENLIAMVLGHVTGTITRRYTHSDQAISVMLDVVGKIHWPKPDEL
jgi:integrase